MSVEFCVRGRWLVNSRWLHNHTAQSDFHLPTQLCASVGQLYRSCCQLLSNLYPRRAEQHEKYFASLNRRSSLPSGHNGMAVVPNPVCRRRPSLSRPASEINIAAQQAKSFQNLVTGRSVGRPASTSARQYVFARIQIPTPACGSVARDPKLPHLGDQRRS